MYSKFIDLVLHYNLPYLAPHHMRRLIKLMTEFDACSSIFFHALSIENILIHYNP